MTLSSTLQEWLEDKKWSSLEEGRRPSIVYEEDMPVIVRRRGVTMTVRQSGGQDLKSISLLTEESFSGSFQRPVNLLFSYLS